MAVSTYDFTTVTVPAGATSHKGTYGTQGPTSNPPAPPAGTEGTQANIDNVESSNDVRWSNVATGGSVNSPYKIFRFYVTDSNITQYTGSAEGYNTNTSGRSYKLWIWNFSTLGWESLGSHTGGSDATVSGSKTTNLANYKDGSNYVYLSTQGTDAVMFDSTLFDDYVKLDVTYTAGRSNRIWIVDGDD